ncbi:5-carboxymethyl-2-hydroxymuconate isomerase [Psychromarinibacter halotolerans]|uniref:5-carboxymethyl-2-hydroxymuconate isomerase n=1 Tax=Psychromarinibacter halotolerans TaxID=1775175 RepID=A0ABV7GST6_9RHOB|nr:5-carboxymethyl-2-hydroxymuconate isomerase [Psychromarinibacter halotolerans]MAQ84950.1 5-carboxymethyl-2-hydroxymuconate isomerase [Maritimibacter sp.]MAQ86260.1 5-carboxymethyl-2-hydroxymuconate isomerase [Maritimibacter sp.]MDF0596990.1 5-carboxymethyl-2-hydroxymuconate isomerase [Psychromarinibacter halotolerans]
MPHIIVEYSANLEEDVDLADLCDVLRASAAAQEIFPETGVRVRAIRCEIYSIADGDPRNGFIDISVRLREGRPLDKRKAATAAIFDAAKNHLGDLVDRRPVMLSLEMRDIDAELAPKLNTVRDFIERKKNG